MGKTITPRKNPEVETVAFSFWEISAIGLDITIKEENPINFVCDLSLEEAKKLHKELGSAIQHYEEIEKATQNYFSENEDDNL